MNTDIASTIVSNTAIQVGRTVLKDLCDVGHLDAGDLWPIKIDVDMDSHYFLVTFRYVGSGDAYRTLNIELLEEQLCVRWSAQVYLTRKGRLLTCALICNERGIGVRTARANELLA